MKSLHNLYILGASSFGREIESWLELIPESSRDWVIGGYFDNFSEEEFLKYPTNYPFLGYEDNFEFDHNDYCIIAVAEPKVRERIYIKLKDRVKFYTYIAPNAIIGKFNTIGEGSIISPNCIITTNVKIGKAVLINIGTQIGHDVNIGNFSSLMANVDIAGKCIIGNNNFIGSHSVIIPSRTIGNNNIIGAGSVVIWNIKDKSTVFGNPAQVVQF